MRTLLLASAALAALTVAGEAATVSYTPYVAGTGSFYAPAATSSSTPPAFTQGQVGSVPGYTTSPFGDDTTPYDVVHANSFATFSGAFGTGSGTFSFLWGTPDDFNSLTFFNTDGTTTTVVGSGNGTGSYVATVEGLSSFSEVKFSSGGEAFEFAAISPVPLPGTLPMLGGAVLLLGALGIRSRRKGASARA